MRTRDLQRFVEAQQGIYEQALTEIKRGRKVSHWIWYIFPQLEGLGMSYNAQYYGIRDCEEARAYLEHPLLGARLREITSAFLQLSGITAVDVFGDLDAMKVRSCMTLFNEVADDSLFVEVLEKYYAGLPDEITIGKLRDSFSSIRGLGAVAGDIIGSVYEFYPVKRIDFELFTKDSSFTDDTVMTVANADWLLTGNDLFKVMKNYGNRYPNAGYGHRFNEWLRCEDAKPYNSWGNGSAMRVSPVGWAFDTLDDTLAAARQSAEITHNHPEGIKGAQATAACIYWARKGYPKAEIKELVEAFFGYDLSRTCDEIRSVYRFDVSCQGSVPESITAFLESWDYESAVRLAVSLGGDADTMGAITGGIAEAFYGDMPYSVRKEVVKRLPLDFLHVIQQFGRRFMDGKKAEGCLA